MCNSLSIDKNNLPMSWTEQLLQAKQRWEQESKFAHQQSLSTHNSEKFKCQDSKQSTLEHNCSNKWSSVLHLASSFNQSTFCVNTHAEIYPSTIARWDYNVSEVSCFPLERTTLDERPQFVSDEHRQSHIVCVNVSSFDKFSKQNVALVFRNAVLLMVKRGNRMEKLKIIKEHPASTIIDGT